jgi:hypothetical protein
MLNARTLRDWLILANPKVDPATIVEKHMVAVSTNVEQVHLGHAGSLGVTCRVNFRLRSLASIQQIFSPFGTGLVDDILFVRP